MLDLIPTGHFPPVCFTGCSLYKPLIQLLLFFV